MKELTYFDPFAMIRPQNACDMGLLLDEALAELRSLNAHFEALSMLPVDQAN